MQCVDCVSEVETLCAQQWQPEEVAQGEHWLEIEWTREDSEYQFMMIYGQANIKAIRQLLSSRVIQQ